MVSVINPKWLLKRNRNQGKGLAVTMNIVQLIGGSGAGKSAIATRLTQLWPGRATHMRANRYLRDRQPTDGDDFIVLPSSVDWPLISLHIEALGRGERVIMPEYNWQVGRRLPPRSPQTSNLNLEPTDLLIINSLFLMPFEIEAAKIFLDTPWDERRNNVKQRDNELDGNFIAHFDAITEPSYQKYTAPLRSKCDIVLNGTLPAEDLVTKTYRYLISLWGGWG